MNNKLSKRIYVSTIGVVALLGIVLLMNKEQIFQSGNTPISPNTTVTPSISPIATPTQELVVIEDPDVPTDPTMGTLITETKYDKMIIPDKYNTGAKGELKKVGLGDMVEGIQLKADGSGKKNAFDFAYRNKEISGRIEIRDYDFSDFEVAFYNEGKVERDIVLVFVNCSFSGFSKAAGESSVLCEFENCSFQHFAGSNASFNQCHFGYSYLDGMNPYNDVTVRNSYFSNMSDVLEQGIRKHTDGTQIFGKNDIWAENIEYYNCRFELPPIDMGDENAYINACIMLQLEYSSGRNMKFDECILNGGGYSMYAHYVKGDYSLSNVLFSNITVGCAKKYGSLYPDISDGVEFSEVSETESLYVSSVWKEDDGVHISVSNDTNQERVLKVYTDKGCFDFSIPACPRGKELVAFSDFEDLPFDLDCVILDDCSYVVCFDVTPGEITKQIRFVNWSGKDVYVSFEKQLKSIILDEVILSGTCGKNANFTLKKDGTLTILGTGATYDYHSGKPTPWIEYQNIIKKVYVEDGITRLGNQLFNKYPSVSEVSLPEGMLSLGTRTFAGCTSLLEISLPESMETLGNNAFTGSTAFSIYCTKEQYERFKTDTSVVSRLKLK